MSQRERHLILSLRVPEPSEAKDTVPLIKEVFTLVDIVDQKQSFKIEVGLKIDALELCGLIPSPQTYKKLKKFRLDLDADLLKESEKEKRDEVGIHFTRCYQGLIDIAGRGEKGC